MSAKRQTRRIRIRHIGRTATSSIPNLKPVKQNNTHTLIRSPRFPSMTRYTVLQFRKPRAGPHLVSVMVHPPLPSGGVSRQIRGVHVLARRIDDLVIAREVVSSPVPQPATLTTSTSGGGAHGCARRGSRDGLSRRWEVAVRSAGGGAMRRC
jgi:hypothetical protein